MDIVFWNIWHKRVTFYDVGSIAGLGFFTRTWDVYRFMSVVDSNFGSRVVGVDITKVYRNVAGIGYTISTFVIATRVSIGSLRVACAIMLYTGGAFFGHDDDCAELGNETSHVEVCYAIGR